MGTCQSCCGCDETDDESSRYANPRKRQRNQPHQQQQSQKKSCCNRTPGLCSCHTDETTDGGTTSSDSNTDIEMGPMALRSINMYSDQQQQQQQQQQHHHHHQQRVGDDDQRPNLSTLFTPFTLQHFPISRVPTKWHIYYTTRTFIRLSPALVELLQWSRKGSWMNMVTGQLAQKPPDSYQQVVPLQAIPMRFELIQIPIEYIPPVDKTLSESDQLLQHETMSGVTYKQLFYDKFGITLTYVTEPIDDEYYGKNISATTPSIFSSLSYVPFLFKELSLYPRSFLDKAGLRKIVLCENLQYQDQVRKAIPIVVSNLLYLDISIEPVYYQQGVLHHEFFHLFDDKILFELKKPVKNPLQFYNTKRDTISRLPRHLSEWFLTGGANSKVKTPPQDQTPTTQINALPTQQEQQPQQPQQEQPKSNDQTNNSNQDHVSIDIDKIDNQQQENQEPSQVQQPETRRTEKKYSPDPYFSPELDPYTSFSVIFILEYLLQRQIVFKHTIMPYLIQQYKDAREKWAHKFNLRQTSLPSPSNLSNSDYPSTPNSPNQPSPHSQQSPPPLDPKYITNKFLQLLTQLFNLQPYFFRSFPAILHLFKHPNYRQQQETILHQQQRQVTSNQNDIIPTPHPTPTTFNPLDNVPLVETTNIQFPKPSSERLDRYLSTQPYFLLKPQYHIKATQHYERHLELEFQQRQRLTEQQQHEQQQQQQQQHNQDHTAIDIHNLSTDSFSATPASPSLSPFTLTNTPIPDYPSFDISLHELFQNPLPATSRGKTYLTYFRTIAVSDFVPQEFNHPLFPNRRYLYEQNKIAIPEKPPPIPPSWVQTDQDKPFTRFSYGFPPLECFQHLFFTQSQSEAIRRNIDPNNIPATRNPPDWCKPTLPLRVESVGSDPLWLLLNFKTFRYGPGGGNFRNADASVTLHKGQYDNKSNSNTNPKKSRPNTSKNSDYENQLVSLSNHNIKPKPHPIGSSDSDNRQLNYDYHSNDNHESESDVPGDETDCVVDGNGSQHRDSLSILQSRYSFSIPQPPPNAQGKSNTEDQGFLNTYSMSAIEEDKAEIFSWLIRHPPAILNSPDPYLRLKGLELWRRLEMFCEDVDEHFLEKLIRHKPFRVHPDDPPWRSNTDDRGYTSWRNNKTDQLCWVDPNMFIATMELF